MAGLKELKMRNTHTPGPWTVAPSSNPKNGSGWRDIHALGSEFSPAYVGEAMLYDAQLIAAAPELLDALLLLCDNIELSKLNVKKDFSLMNAHANACKAIRKARGL